MNVIVIGGGASGLMAAITAAKGGHSVTLLERQARVGRKLLSTGNGRCNLTNLNMGLPYYHGQDAAFIRPAFEALSLDATLDFFHGLGLLTTAEDNGRVYPYSDQAGSVVDVLRFAADAAGDLHNDVFFVIGVFGKEQNLDFFGKGLLLRLGGGVGFLTKLLHFRVGHQLLSVRHVLLRLIVGVKGLHNGFQVIFFPKQLRRLLGVGVKIRLLGFGGKLFVFIADGL